MKITSDLKNTKADKEIKHANLIAANGRCVRHSGKVFRIRVATIGEHVIADAQGITGNQPIINLFDETQLAKDIKKLCENRLYS